MLFTRPNGEGVEVVTPSGDAEPVIDRSTMRLARGETFERYKSLGFSVDSISRIFNIGVSTIHADLLHLTRERKRRAAEGDPLPAFGT